MLKKEVSEMLDVLKIIKEDKKYWFFFCSIFVSLFFSTIAWNFAHLNQVIAQNIVITGIVNPSVLGIVSCVAGIHFFCKKKNRKNKIQFLLCQVCLAYIFLAILCVAIEYGSLWNIAMPILFIAYWRIEDLAGSYFTDGETYRELFHKVFTSIRSFIQKRRVIS